MSLSRIVLATAALLLVALPGEHGAANDGVSFDADPLRFAPSTIVSAHFLGAEPQTTIERRLDASTPGRLSADRVFVDWPLGGRSQIGQLSRSTDGGNSFRLIFDFACAERSRPTCLTGGGGDTDNEVSPFDGTVFFSDLESVPQVPPANVLFPANVAVATSKDHGDTFPRDRQFAISNTTTAIDRQWLTAIDPTLVSIATRSIHGFVSYKRVDGDFYVQAIDEDGAIIAQPQAQLVKDVIRSGQIRVDNTAGPGRGWLYQVYFGGERGLCPCNLKVATAEASSYQDPLAWDASTISEDEPTIFPWLALDSDGNAYAVWVTGGVVYYSASPIADTRNNPSVGGRPGTFWTDKQRVSLPEVGSAIFPEVIAGDRGRIAVAYDGTTDHTGESALAPATARWHTYAAVITDALGFDRPPTVRTGRVSHRVIHTGSIDCRGGCPDQPGDADDSLLDLIDIGVDEEGRVGVVFTDNNSTFATPEGRESNDKLLPFAHFAKQIAGPSLLEGEDVDELIPTNDVSDRDGDATWPNTSSGTLLPSLDLGHASLFVEGDSLVARLSLSAATPDAMERDLRSYNDADYNGSEASTPPADRFQYVVRLLTDDDIYHLSMESRADGTRRYFGGRLDDNDAITNAFGNVIAAGYHTDASFPAEGQLDANVLELRAPLSLFEVQKGSQVFSVTAFALAGPSEEDEELANMMRTVDATPPFDAILVERPPVINRVPVSLALSPSEATTRPGRSRTIAAVVLDADGEPVAEASVDWKLTGVGGFKSMERTTDENGRAEAVVSSEEKGNQVITASTSGCGEQGVCADSAVLHWGPRRCDVFGTSGSDRLSGTSRGDVICAFGGNDVIRARRGDDVVVGGAGRDRIFGGKGDDRARGGANNDEIRGRRGADVLRGGAGADTVFGGRGRDALRGGPGADTLRGGRKRDSCRGGRGSDTVRNCER